MSNIIDKLKSGDLIAVAYDNCTYPAIYHKTTGVSLQYYIISGGRLEDWKKIGVKHANKNYINCYKNHYRVVKITEDSLTDGDLAIYKEMKALYEGISV